MQWFLDNRQDLAAYISYCESDSDRQAGDATPRGRRLWPFPRGNGCSACCATCSTKTSFSRLRHPLALARSTRTTRSCSGPTARNIGSTTSRANRRSGLFGGNSNWRGPIWMPINFLLVEALERYHHFYGDELKVECPTGSGQKLTLKEVAREIEARVAQIFLADRRGVGPATDRCGNSPTIRTGATTCFSTSISTATTAAAAAPATRPAGRPSSRGCCGIYRVCRSSRQKKRAPSQKRPQARRRKSRAERARRRSAQSAPLSRATRAFGRAAVRPSGRASQRGRLRDRSRRTTRSSAHRCSSATRWPTRRALGGAARRAPR